MQWQWTSSDALGGVGDKQQEVKLQVDKTKASHCQQTANCSGCTTPKQVHVTMPPFLRQSIGANAYLHILLQKLEHQQIQQIKQIYTVKFDICICLYHYLPNVCKSNLLPHHLTAYPGVPNTAITSPNALGPGMFPSVQSGKPASLTGSLDSTKDLTLEQSLANWERAGPADNFGFKDCSSLWKARNLEAKCETANVSSAAFVDITDKQAHWFYIRLQGVTDNTVALSKP
ncbi:hypothetical protein DFJ73DRAFT_760868 [Zopfochytrium polystomum]|nr:hypothetical protein DFJ73DRAFT_760868 [Zopfochytrium polystomum]